MPECFIKSGWTCTKTSGFGRFGWRFLLDLAIWMDSVPRTDPWGLVDLPAFSIIYHEKQPNVYRLKNPSQASYGVWKGNETSFVFGNSVFLPATLGTLRHRWSDGVLVPAIGGYFHMNFEKQVLYGYISCIYLDIYVWLCIYLSLQIYTSYGCTGIPTIGYSSCLL